MSFETALQKVLVAEGVFSDDANDPGGATKFGITEHEARVNGYAGDMRAMPLDIAKNIYRKQYWDTLRLDDVDMVSPAIATKLFDLSVNMGIGTGGQFLQRVLTELNRQGRDYPDLEVDGVIGPTTVAALRAFLQKRGTSGETVVLRALNGLQLARYMDIAQARPTSEDFLYGWILQRVS